MKIKISSTVIRQSPPQKKKLFTWVKAAKPSLKLKNISHKRYGHQPSLNRISDKKTQG